MKIAVTGASGFIGQYVVDRFADHGHELVALGRNRDRLVSAFKNMSVACRETDYTVATLCDHFDDCDVVLHLAAKRPASDTDPLDFGEFYGPNVETTQNVLIAATQTDVKRVCQASSISVYAGSRKVPYAEDQRPIPADSYGASKVVCENLGGIAERNYGLDVVSLRIASTYGVGERSQNVLMKFVDLARDNETLTVWGSGSHAPDFIYVEDVVEAFERSIASDVPAGIYNIGSGRHWPIADLARTINTVFGNRGNLVFDESKIENEWQYHMDCSKTAANLGWEPEYSLTDGLRAMREEYNSPAPN